MSIVYFIITTIIIALFADDDNKNIVLFICMLILFIPFGLQYEVTRDWSTYYARWYGTNVNHALLSTRLEYFYALLIKLSKPFGLFGFLMLSAAAGLSTFYIYFKKYVPNIFLWMSLALLMLQANMGFTYIDANRQFLAIIFSMLSMYTQINTFEYPKEIYKYALSAILLIASINIHTSAIIAIPIIFFPIICDRIQNSKYLYIFLFLYVFSYYVNFESVASYFETIMSGQESFERFSHYTEEIAWRDKSIVEQSLYFIHLLLFIYYFDEFDNEIKPLVLASIIFFSLQGYAMYSMARAFQFYQVYTLISLPCLFKLLLNLNEESLFRKNISYAYIAVVFLYAVYSFNRDMQNDLYTPWYNFQTILSAPSWM